MGSSFLADDRLVELRPCEGAVDSLDKAVTGSPRFA